MKRNKQLINLILVLIVLNFVLSCRLFNFNSSSDTPANGVNTTNKTVNESAEFESISATDLYNAYKKDQAAADQKFKGKTIVVTGEISLVTEKSLTGEPVAAFKVDGKDGVSGKFIESQKAAVGKLKEGQTATFKCQVKGPLVVSSFAGVLLQNCEVAPTGGDSSAVKQSDPTSIEMPAPPSSPSSTLGTSSSPLKTGTYYGTIKNTTYNHPGNLMLRIDSIDSSGNVQAYFETSNGLSGHSAMTGKVTDGGKMKLSGTIHDGKPLAVSATVSGETITGGYATGGEESTSGNFTVRRR